MYHQLIANIETNLTFYRRNRILAAAGVFIVIVLGLSTLPSMFFISKSRHLDIVRTVFNQIASFSTIATAGLGLMLISQHIRDRSVKMVFTKPCLPEVWLLSSFLSAGLVAFVLFAGALFIASALSAIWGIPFLSGIAFIAANEFFQAIGLMAYATFLSVIFHPVIAVLFLLIFQEGMFYYLNVFLASGIKAAGASAVVPLLKLIKLFAGAAYMILPTFKPYSDKMTGVYSTLRGPDADWKYLLLSIAYSLALAALFFFLTDYALKKKRYV